MAGGVAANASVRSALQAVAEAAGLSLVCPPPRLCTDNGVMVAWAGAERLALGLAEPPPPPLRSANGAALPERLTVPVSSSICTLLSGMCRSSGTHVERMYNAAVATLRCWC